MGDFLKEVPQTPQELSKKDNEISPGRVIKRERLANKIRSTHPL